MNHADYRFIYKFPPCEHLFCSHCSLGFWFVGIVVAFVVQQVLNNYTLIITLNQQKLR